MWRRDPGIGRGVESVGRLRAAVGVVLEGLEGRRLLAAGVEVVEGTLIVTGTKGDDVIELTMTPLPPEPAPGEPTWIIIRDVVVKINGVEHGAHPGVMRIEVRCGRGDDVVTASASRDTVILGGRGADTLTGGDHRDSIYGHAGNDVIEGGGMEDGLFGGAGADTIAGGSGADTLFGGGGSDAITYEGADSVNGGRGKDRIREDAPPPQGPEPAYEIDANGILKVIGTAANDHIIVSYVGPDSFTVEPVTDPYFVVYVNGLTSKRIADELVKGIRMEGLGGNDNLFAGHEAAIADVSEHELPTTLLGGAGNDTISGANGRDSVDGGDGNDDIAGGEGDDVLMGGAGNDTIRGDMGKDLVNGGDGDDGVGGGTHIMQGTDPDDSVFGDAGNDVFMTQGDVASEHKDRASGEGATEVVFPPESRLVLMPLELSRV